MTYPAAANPGCNDVNPGCNDANPNCNDANPNCNDAKMIFKLLKLREQKQVWDSWVHGLSMIQHDSIQLAHQV